MKKLSAFQWVVIVVLVLLLMTGSVGATGVALWILGDTDPSDGEVLKWNTANNRAEFSATDRFWPQIFACSMTGNSSSSVGSCEDVDFNGVELSVVEFTVAVSDSEAYFHILSPPDFGTGGTTTVDVSYGWRVADGSAGGVTFSTRAAGNITALRAESWTDSDADPWTINDEIVWTAYETITIAGVTTGEQNLYFGVKLQSENCDATAIYLDKVVFKTKGV